MADETEEPLAKLTQVSRKVKIAVLAAAVMFIVLPFSLIYLQRHLHARAQEAEQTLENDSTDDDLKAREDFGGKSPAQPLTTVPPPPDDSDSAPSVGSLSKQQLALQEAKLLRIRNQGERIRGQWEALSAAQTLLAMSLKPLGSDEAGSRIASSPELIDQYAALRQTALPAAQLTEELQGELAILLKPLDEIEATQIEPDYTAALAEISGRIDAQLIAVKRDQRMLDALLSVASNRAAQTISLQTALEQRSNELAEARLTDIADAVAVSRQAEIDRVTQESAEEQRKIADAQREVQRLKEQQRLQVLEDERRVREAAIAKAALEREFQRDLPQIRSLLRPLITEGLTQPGRNSFEPADQKGPVSLAKLRGTGALGPTAKARGGLYYIVSTNNDRDLGSFPRYIGGAQDVQAQQRTMMRVQELVNKYGELMVEKGLMAE